MQINNSNFQDLIQNLPSIHIELEYEDNEGSDIIEDLELITGNYILFVNFNICQVISVDKGDRLTKPSIESKELIIEDISFIVTHKSIEGEISLTEVQKAELSNKINSLIYTNVL